ncbi:MAG: N-acetylmuramoyl-L-alanine amidase, partial [Armatimonadota bacterium]|nr:N-acetylmuramoyl-L-alanine amidase [Armatimonadota bacterium]
MKTWPSVERCVPALRGLSAGERAIRCVVLHHTWRPDHAGWRGDAGAEAILAFWLRRQRAEGWRNPPGAHFLVAPDGRVYAPFQNLALPLNANGNANANREGVAVEAVGDFDTGRDLLQGVQ